MLEKYEEFKKKRKAIRSQKKQLKQQIDALNKQNLKIKMDQFNQQRSEIQKKMNQYVAGPSNYA